MTLLLDCNKEIWSINWTCTIWIFTCLPWNTRAIVCQMGMGVSLKKEHREPYSPDQRCALLLLPITAGMIQVSSPCERADSTGCWRVNIGRAPGAVEYPFNAEAPSAVVTCSWFCREKFCLWLARLTQSWNVLLSRISGDSSFSIVIFYLPMILNILLHRD